MAKESLSLKESFDKARLYAVTGSAIGFHSLIVGGAAMHAMNLSPLSIPVGAVALAAGIGSFYYGNKKSQEVQSNALKAFDKGPN